MNKVNVATLKGKLSFYLKLVQEGEEVLVTSYRQPVARIVPPHARSQQISRPSRPVSDVRGVKGLKRRITVSAVRSLVEDRQAR